MVICDMIPYMLLGDDLGDLEASLFGFGLFGVLSLGVCQAVHPLHVLFLIIRHSRVVGDHVDTLILIPSIH